MFWNNYYNLCSQKGISPNAAAKEMNISSGAVTERKKGRVPQMATLKKIADYFGVSVNELTKGPETSEVEPSPGNVELNELTNGLNAEEIEELKRYAAYLLDKRNKK